MYKPSLTTGRTQTNLLILSQPWPDPNKKCFIAESQPLVIKPLSNMSMNSDCCHNEAKLQWLRHQVDTCVKFFLHCPSGGQVVRALEMLCESVGLPAYLAKSSKAIMGELQYAQTNAAVQRRYSSMNQPALVTGQTRRNLLITSHPWPDPNGNFSLQSPNPTPNPTLYWFKSFFLLLCEYENSRDMEVCNRMSTDQEAVP